MFAVAALSANTLFSMAYFPGKFNSEEGERNLKWSTCVWGNNVNFETEFLPGKPGPNDMVVVRPGRYEFELDGNYSVSEFATGDGSRSFATGKTFKFRRNLRMTIATSNSSVTRQDWDKCVVDVGGPFEIRFWTEARQAGIAKLSMTDTKMSIRGDISCIIPANPILQNENRAGVEIAVEGDSLLQFAGGAVIDSLIEESNDQWMFKWTFSDKDGKLPKVTFAKRAEFNKCDLEVTVSDKVKSGKYGLIEFADKKSGLKDLRSVTVNGSEYKLGDAFKLGNRTAKLMLAPSGKDASTPNDLVLDISK